MKKVICLIIFIFLSTGLFAVGIGPQLDITPGLLLNKNEAITEAGISCSIKMDNVPIVIGVATDYSIIQQTFDACGSLDFWIFNPMIGDYCSFFTGIGASSGASFSDKDIAFTAGGRALFGFNWILYDGFMEYFVQAAIQPTGRFGNDSLFQLKFPVNAGIRLYF